MHGATYRVRGVSYDDVLYMRRWPSPRSRIVKALAADARNVVLIRRKGRWGKVMFRWMYWNILLKGKEMPITAHMTMAGKWR